MKIVLNTLRTNLTAEHLISNEAQPKMGPQSQANSGIP